MTNVQPYAEYARSLVPDPRGQEDQLVNIIEADGTRSLHFSNGLTWSPLGTGNIASIVTAAVTAIAANKANTTDLIAAFNLLTQKANQEDLTILQGQIGGKLNSADATAAISGLATEAEVVDLQAQIDAIAPGVGDGDGDSGPVTDRIYDLSGGWEKLIGFTQGGRDWAIEYDADGRIVRQYIVTP